MIKKRDNCFFRQGYQGRNEEGVRPGRERGKCIRGEHETCAFVEWRDFQEIERLLLLLKQHRYNLSIDIFAIAFKVKCHRIDRCVLGEFNSSDAERHITYEYPRLKNKHRSYFHVFVAPAFGNPEIKAKAKAEFLFTAFSAWN